ncbi:MAG: hypothetical protein H8E45_07360 [Proteobacteria bacterium]|nr:hypothetical protein [Pseudomonadota bacterium]
MAFCNFERWKHPRRAVFWHLSRSGLVAAVIEAADEEPLLLACADAQASLGGADSTARGLLVCPGIAELALLLRATGLPQIAALSADCGAVVRAAGSGSDPAGAADLAPGTVRVQLSAAAGMVAGSHEELLATAPRQLVAGVKTLFSACGLRLVELGLADIAADNLAELSPPGNGETVDPLMAVSVAPGCEEQAGRLGSRLVVPVGLALGRMGFDATTG